MKHIREYDQNPAEVIKGRYRKKKRRRILKVFKIIVIVALTIAYLVSPYSKITNITINGNRYVDTNIINEAMGCKVGDFNFISFSGIIKNKVSSIEGVTAVKVKKNYFSGEMTISITEAVPIAYQENENSFYIIMDNQSIVETEKKTEYNSLTSLPKLSGFDIETLKKFVSEFIQVDQSVRLQMSDIIFSPSEADPNKVIMITDSNKEIVTRINDISYHLSYFNSIIKQNNSNCYFDFLGSNVYQRACQ